MIHGLSLTSPVLQLVQKVRPAVAISGQKQTNSCGMKDGGRGWEEVGWGLTGKKSGAHLAQVSE